MNIEMKNLYIKNFIFYLGFEILYTKLLFKNIRNEDLALLKSNEVDIIEILPLKHVIFNFFRESQIF